MAIETSKGSYHINNQSLKLKNAVSFSGLQNSFLSFRNTTPTTIDATKHSKQIINWGNESQLGCIKFSNQAKPEILSNVQGGLVTKIESSKNEIKMFDLDNNLKAHIKLEDGFDPKQIEIGFQNQKNFGLNVRYNGQSYILYDMGKDNPSYAKLDNKFSVEINPPSSNQVAFRGTINIDKTKSLTEAELSAIINKTMVGMLAGGFGSRLLAHSGEGTKPTVEYGGSSFVNRVIHLAHEQGFKKFGASLYNKPEFTKSHIETGNPDLPIVFSTQNNHTGNLGTAGAVRHLAETMVGTELAEATRYVRDLQALDKILDQFLGKNLKATSLKNELKNRLQYSDNFQADLKDIVTMDHTLRKNIFEARMDFAKDQYPGFLILSGDHCTNIDLRSFVKKHVESKAQLTVALQQINQDKIEELKHQNPKQCQLGVACIPDVSDMKISEFKEKPYWSASAGHGKENTFNQQTDSWANTGIYIFSPEQILKIDSADTIIKRRNKEHQSEKAEMCDIGKHIIPGIVEEMKNSQDQVNHLQGYSIENTYWKTLANSKLQDADPHRLQGHIQPGNALWADLGTPNSLFDHLPTLINDIVNNNGHSSLIEHGQQGFDTEFTFPSAVSRRASYNTLNLVPENRDTILVAMDGVTIHPKTRIAGSNYFGKDQDIPPGSYRNVWVSAQPNSLFKEPLNVVA